jgi:hypothetical protein
VNSVVDQLKYKSVLDVVEEINKVATVIRVRALPPPPRH